MGDAGRRADGLDRPCIGLQLKESEAGLGDRELRGQVATLLVAGYETTAVGLTWAFSLLSFPPRPGPGAMKSGAPYPILNNSAGWRILSHGDDQPGARERG